MGTNWKRVIEKIEAATKDEVAILKSLLDPVNSKICPNCKECCCVEGALTEGCSASGGYYMKWCDPTSLAFIKYLKKRYKFTKKLGFWSPEKGCKLPQHLRSYTCLRYFCGKEQKLLKDLDITMARYLVNRIRTIKKQIFSD